MLEQHIPKLRLFIQGESRDSQAGEYFDVWDPSTGQLIARAPQCTPEEVESAVQSVREAFPSWADTPAMKRVQVRYKFRDLIDGHLDELTRMVATENGKVWEKAQGDVLCQAKNHALVLEDAPLERTARGIINGGLGCAGERCMALPVVVVQESIADALVSLLVKFAKERKIGPAYDRSSELGPVVTQRHREFVTGWIEKGLEEGAELALDGRGIVVRGYQNGFYLGPTIFDHVKPGMSIGDEEVFGPVICVKRVKDFEEGLALMNANRFANGSVIFTQNGHYSREFARRTHAGMVGVNVGIPVPVSLFPFTGHKTSFLGDLHAMGKDGIRFFTECKCVTTTWFDERQLKREKIDTWDGVLGSR